MDAEVECVAGTVVEGVVEAHVIVGAPTTLWELVQPAMRRQHGRPGAAILAV
jgi:hypothetical protein